jgi:hypothetical protein
MRLWLTRRPNGTYMLTKLRPLIRKRLGSDEFDAYERTEPGEPIGVRHLCEEGVRAVLGTILPTLTPRRVLFALTLQPQLTPDGLGASASASERDLTETRAADHSIRSHADGAGEPSSPRRRRVVEV